MRLRTDVKLITYLKNKTAELVKSVSDEGRSVVITQNGKAKVVVMDVELYDRWRWPRRRSGPGRRSPRKPHLLKPTLF